MPAHRQDGMPIPGADTLTRESAPATDRDAEAELRNSAKTTATAIGRAALLGIEPRSVGSAAWLLSHAHGACIGMVYGHEALAAAVAGFETARDDVMAIIRAMGGAP